MIDIVGKPALWIDWFFNKESAPTMDHLRKTELFETFDTLKTEDQIQDSLLKYNEIAFIYKQNFGRKK